MKKQIYKKEVKIPSIEEFSIQYPQYSNFAKAEGNVVFSKLMTPRAFIRGLVCTIIELPAVTGIAKLIVEDISPLKGKPGFNFSKQYIGALMCSLMEANGYSKSGKKRAIPRSLFTKGEVYKKS